MIYLSVHSFGAFYTWNETNNNFQYLLGEEVRSTVLRVLKTRPRDLISLIRLSFLVCRWETTNMELRAVKMKDIHLNIRLQLNW